MQEPDPFALTAVRRRAVADLLAGLDENQLTTPSLCAGWDVRTVGAHLADAAAPGALGEFARDLVRARGRLHRANDEAARRAGRRPVAETVALLRERAESRFTPPVTGPRAPLAEVLVHEGDMRLPLGLPFDPDPAAVRVALEFVTTGRPVGFVPRGRLRGLRLVATDLDWSAGDGAEACGRGIDLLLAACGRTAVLTELAGPGRQLLESRSS
ncbi:MULTISPECIES: maleylpyruvate isomerase family mycothiol-dependent enzyme [unclassified Modestobacter]